MTDHKANAEALDIALYGKPDIYTPPEDFMPRRTAIAEKLAELYPDRDAVDHTAEAERLIKFAEGNGSESAATAAVAHATLALAQQQRIANLIALEAFKVHQYGSWGGPSLVFGNPATEFGNVPILDELREGLGL